MRNYQTAIEQTFTFDSSHILHKRIIRIINQRGHVGRVGSVRKRDDRSAPILIRPVMIFLRFFALAWVMETSSVLFVHNKRESSCATRPRGVDVHDTFIAKKWKSCVRNYRREGWWPFFRRKNFTKGRIDYAKVEQHDRCCVNNLRKHFGWMVINKIFIKSRHADYLLWFVDSFYSQDKEKFRSFHIWKWIVYCI